MKIPGLRWAVAGMLFAAAVLNYIDRQTLSLLAPTIQRDLGMSDAAYANVVNAFLVAYILSYLVSGRIVDRLGVRKSYAGFVALWSVANMLTAAVRSTFSLGTCRFLLGLGEAGNWTASPKAVSEWFPPRERAVAIGVYTMGATLGATLAPPLIVPLAARYGWQMAFVATGLLGLLWVAPWIWLYRRPQEHPRLSDAERAVVLESTAEEGLGAAAGATWAAGPLLAHGEVWRLMLARLLTDPVWYFFQFWFAKYLFTACGVPQERLSVTWVVFLAADLGALAGGWLSGAGIRRGAAPASSRIRVMLGCALLAPLGAFIPAAQGPGVALALASIVVFAHLAWLTNISALVVDVVPRASLGSVFGLVAAGSAVGGVGMNKLVAWLVSSHSYAHWFFAAACLHPVAWLLIRRLAPRNPAFS